MDSLQKRGLIVPNWCSLCKLAAESIDHIFMECSFSQKVWHRFSSTLSFTGSNGDSNPTLLLFIIIVPVFYSFLILAYCLLYIKDSHILMET
ncbi:hypothetical protein LINGRAHAP2_LOCUS30968 [Linum grandiflorum]